MKKLTILYVLFVLVSYSSCAQKTESNNSLPETSIAQPEMATNGTKEMISPKELKELMVQHPEIQIIDVRTPDEIKQGKIANALEFNVLGNDFESQINGLDKNKEYVVYCKAGGRSARAQQAMKAAGIAKVTNLAGGYDQWKSSGN